MKGREKLLDLIFPPSCVGCGSGKGDQNPLGWLCFNCISGITINPWIFCGICSRRLLGMKRCQIHENTALRGVGVAADYNNPIVKRAIVHYKYRFGRDLAEPLSNILAEYFEKTFGHFVIRDAILVPIPLSPKRERWRGFNQAEELAGLVAAKLKIPCQPKILIRPKHKRPQMEIPLKKERFNNVAGVFSVANIAAVKNQNIILVDDVTTSGATLESAARTLKQAGAKTVWGLVIARG